MKKRSKKHVDIDDLQAGDEIDGQLAQYLYGNINTTWFIQDKGKCAQYFGPRFSCKITDAMDALHYYRKHYGRLITSYCLLEHLEGGPYACTAELRLVGKYSSPVILRSWAPTLPLAITRVLLKAPKQ